MKNRNATLRRWLVSLLLLALMAGLPLAGLAAQPPPDPIIDNDLDNEIGVDHPQNPGDVMLFKQATPVSGMVNVWDVVLRIEGRDQQKTSDIVLVIDTSGSMGDYGRMAAAKDAATSFVNTLLAPTAPSAANTQIAVVSFQSTVNTRQGLTNNQQDLHDAINRLNASGGTYTQAAVRRAEDILANSQADYKNIVLLSDGVPTYSYAMNNPGNYLNSQFIAEASSFDQYGRHYPNGNRQATTDNAPSSAYTTSRVGAGFAMFHRYYNPDGITNDRYYNHGNSAIAEAGFAKASGYTMWTIALDAGDDGNDVLGGMASTGKAYTGSPGDLQTIFQDIAGSISAAVQNASVSDPMGVGFQTIGSVSAITKSQGEVTLSQNNTHIDWAVGTLATPIAVGSDIKYAEMSYKVEINDDILTMETPGDGLYAVNGNATLAFTNTAGQSIVSSFPNPMENPVLMVVEKRLLGSFGEVIEDENRHFVVNVQGKAGTDTAGYNEDYELIGGQRRVLTSLRLQGQYRVTEQTFAEAHHTSDDYASTLTIGGTSNPEFTVTAPEDPDFYITATNQELPLGALTVKKVFSLDGTGGTAGTAPGEGSPVFTFKVTGPTGWDATAGESGEYIYGEYYKDGQRLTLRPGEEYTFTGLPYGTYTVEELPLEGYTASYNPADGKAALDIYNKTATITVTNRPADGETQVDVLASKTWVGGNEEDHKPVPLTLLRDGVALSPQPAPAVTPTTPTAATFNYTWADLPKFDEYGRVYAYTVEEQTGYLGYQKAYELVNGVHAFTNTYQPITITAEKVFRDADGNLLPEDEKVPVSLLLFKDGARYPNDGTVYPVDGVVDTVPAGSSGELEPWVYTWTNLPRINADGSVIAYMAGETPPNNFVREQIVGNMQDGFIITNTYREGTFRAKKYWYDAAGNVVAEPAAATSVTFALYQRPDTDDFPPDQHNYEMVYMGPAYPDIPLNGTPDATGEEEAWVAVWTGLPGNGYFLIDGQTQYVKLAYYAVEVAPFPAGYDAVTSASTHVYNRPNTNNITANKVWENGDAVVNRPTVYFQLQRLKVAADGSLIDGQTVQPVPDTAVVALDGSETTAWHHTWQDMPIYVHEPEGPGTSYAWVYSVLEVIPDGAGGYTTGPGAHPDNYTKEEIGLTVTNTYVIPTTSTSARKIWVGGENANDGVRPNVWFELYRSSAAITTPEKVAGAEIKQVTLIGTDPDTYLGAEWSGIDATDIDGNPYTFTVKEVVPNPAQPGTYIDGTPDNYTKEEDGLTVTNTYQTPATTASAKKIWVGGEDFNGGVRPPVWFELYRSSAIVTIPEKVVGAEIKQVALIGTAPDTYLGAEWTGLDATDSSGNPYTFTVKEVMPNPDQPGAYIDGKPDNYTKLEEGLTVTNTYLIPTNASASAKKLWSGGQNFNGGVRPDVWFELYRSSATLADPEKVDGAEIKKVAEIGTAPDTYLGAEWTGLEATDSSGNTYTFSVKEGVYNTENAFVIGPPENYISIGQAGLNVTNLFVSPTAAITATKHWEGGGPEPWPEVDFTLTYGLTTGLENEFSTVPLDGTLDADEGGSGELEAWTYTWKSVPLYDDQGNPYRFMVSEVQAPPNYAASATTGDHEAGYHITNTWQTREITAAKEWNLPAGYTLPDSATVQFKLSRHILDENNNPVADAEFGLVVTLNGEVDDVAAGQSGELEEWLYTWKGLPQNNPDNIPYVYTLQETDWPASFTAGAVTGNMTDGFSVTNTYQATEYQAKKVYANVPEGKAEPEITFRLYQDGQTLPEYPNVTVTGTADTSLDPNSSGEHEAWIYTWKNLPKYKDKLGQVPHVYTAAEIGVPQGYVLTWVVGEGITTFTNTWRGDTYTAIKQWYPEEVPAPAGAEVALELWRGYAVPQMGDPLDVLAGTGIMNGVIDTEVDPTLNPLDDNGEFTKWNYTWNNVPGNEEGTYRTYKYYIKEVAVTLPAGSSYDTMTAASNVVKNYSAITDFTATKKWVGGPQTGREVTLELWRTWEGAANPEHVVGQDGTLSGAGVGTGETTGELPPTDANTWHYKWVGLPRYQNPGNETTAPSQPYTYFIQEKPVENYPSPVYSPTTTPHTVTNTYVSPTVSKTGVKLWMNGPTTHPVIAFELFRRIEGGTETLVYASQNGGTQTLTPPATMVTWHGVDETDANGNPYIYSIREYYQSVEGPPPNYDVVYSAEDYTPEGKAEIIGALIARNYYNASGSITLGGIKTFTGRAPLATDDFTFELYKDSIAEGNLLDSTTRNGSGNYAFESLLYEIDLLADPANPRDDVGQYTYVIRESRPAVNPSDGITYDETLYTLKLAVSDNGNGTLAATITEVLKDGVTQTLNPAAPFSFDLANTYAATGSLTLTGTKAMTGRALKDGDNFTYTVKDGETTVATGSSDSTGTITFTAINYTLTDVARSPITLTLTEDASTVDGVTADPNSYTITVTLKDDGEGNITATPDYPLGGLVITNTYAAQGDLTLTGTKAMTGRALKEGDNFTYTVKDGETAVATGSSDSTGTITFTAINYTLTDVARSPITLTLTEDASTVDGVTADPNTHTITVTLEDDGEGNITASPAYPTGGLVITNTYAAQGDLTLTGTKAMTGRALKDGDNFTYTVKDGETTVATGSSDSTGIITFTAINYTLTDVARSPITLTVTEDASTVDGVTADPNTHTITVTLTDDGEGNITATPDYPTGGLVITNTYATTGTLTLTGTKTMTGRALKDGDNFTYTVKEGETTVATGSSGSTGAITFTPISYTLADLARSPITLSVREDATFVGGVTTDSNTHTITVTLEDDGEGNITASPAYPTGGLVVTNTYAATGTLTLTGTKAMTGRALKDGDNFTYTVKEGETTVATGSSDSTGAITFLPIFYTLTDVARSPITISVKEDASTVDAVTADPNSYTITVTLEDDGEGNITATPAYPAGGLVITNTYTAQGDLTLTASKTMEGRELAPEDLFTFTVKKGDETVATGANNGTGTITFTPISFTQEDTLASPITLTIAEDATTRPGVVIDPNSYEISVALTDEGGGEITAAATYPVDGLVFTNLYEPELTDITAKKVWVDGPEADHTAVNLSLWRAIPGADATLVEGAAPAITPPEGAADSFTYTWADQPVHDPDNNLFTYLVKEEGETEGEVLVNGNRYAVTMAEATITNTFLPPGAAELVLSIEKQLTGGTLSAGQFGFKMTGEAVDETIRNDAAGSATFPAVPLTEPGEFSYTITEINEGLNRVTYDTSSYEAKVTVTLDPETNLLSQETVITKNGAAHTGAILFTNTIDPDPDPISVPVQVMKRTEGFALNAGDFSFTLYDRPGDAVETVKNREKGEVVFDPIRIPRAGTYVFTIKEVPGSRPSVHYDPGVIQVRITAKELGGVLSATVSYAKDGVPTANPAFVNSLEMPPTGDQNLRLPLILLALSALAGAGWLITRRRHRKA